MHGKEFESLEQLDDDDVSRERASIVGKSGTDSNGEIE